MRTGRWLIFSRRLRCFAAVAVVAFAAFAGAQTLSMVPAEVDLSFKPGAPVEFKLTIGNEGNSSVALRASVTDLWYNEKNEKLFSPPGTSPHSAANWIECVPRSLEVAAHSSGSLRVIITPPDQASGGYYAVVFVESRPSLVEAPTKENKNKAVFANIRLGSLVLLHADGTARPRISVSDPVLIEPTSKRNLSLEFTVANQGNVHLFPRPAVAILDAGHQLIAKAEGDVHRFLPGQSDHLKVNWSGTLVPGQYTAILTLLYGDSQVYTQEFPFVVTPDP